MAIPGNKTNFWFKIKAKQKRSLELNSESPAWNAIAITSLGHITLSQPQFSPPENGRTTTWQHSTTNWIWYLDKCAWHCSWYSSSPGTSSEPSRHSINMCWMIMKWKWENPQEPLLFFFFQNYDRWSTSSSGFPISQKPLYLCLRCPKSKVKKKIQKAWEVEVKAWPGSG